MSENFNIRITGALLLLLLIVSCSQNADLHSFLDSAYEKIINKDFDAAQSDLL